MKKSNSKTPKKGEAVIIQDEKDKAVNTKETAKEPICVNGFTEEKVLLAENFINTMNRYTTLDAMASVIYRLKGTKPLVAGCGTCLHEKFKAEIRNYARLGRATLDNYKVQKK